MATILRVKRRNDDEPLDAFYVACKRQKLDGVDDCSGSSDPEALTAVAKFAGTVTDQEANVVEHLAKTLTKDQLKVNYKQHAADILHKTRMKTQEESRENRYKVVNKFRSMGTIDIEEIDDKGMTVIDVEDLVSCSTKETPDNESSAAYVYDLYYTQTEEHMTPDDCFSIRPIDQELVFDNYRDVAIKSDDEESENSNSESNWRNDYPDSDHSENSIEEDDIKEAVSRLKVDGEDSDLSSENSEFVYALDEDDVNNYGYKYAKYKASLEKELGEDHSDDSDCGIRITEIDNDDDDSNCGVRITEIDDDDDADDDQNCDDTCGYYDTNDAFYESD